MRTNNVAIVGGGTAGLVTALILKSYFPYMKVDLIESKAVGIVGVGEGSTEHWARFMKQCRITLKELMEETDATFKYGINFANWNGDNQSYIQSVNGEMNINGPAGIKFVYAQLIAERMNPLFLTKPYVVKSELKEHNYNINQFHFNTFKLNDFLHKKCAEAGVGLIDAELNEIPLTEDGSIAKLKAKDGREFEYDFYVDSTGFARIIVHKTMGVKWLSQQKYLPMNSAIAFPTEREENIPAWTLSRSMNSGWLWRIPTQERFGNGYVFNDQFCDFDKAKQEVEALYGHEVQVAKQIKFDAGYLEKSWNKNCVAIGLSGSFVEPLEASSIGHSIQQAFILAETLPRYVPGNSIAETVFNKHSDEIVKNIFDFVALHYRVKRNDTDFWKSVKDLPMTTSLAEQLEIYKYRIPTDNDFDNRRVLFQGANWIIVMHGLGLIDPEVARKEIQKLPKIMADNIVAHMPPMDMSGTWISHRQAIENLKNSE